jgi:hypothetical protein
MAVVRPNSAASDALNYQLSTLNSLKWVDTQDQKPG